MRLTHIKLAGFKSFVDPTTISVPGQLVGIVGPNGCGKSNVIDAVRWVLGETRASALRGDSMQDVIFNGSGGRKPHARASVELVFDNSMGRATGQWSTYAEISVRRVLQRDGESSYYINNTHVRRRDITDMFLGTGLGPRAYAIIEQGMISRVIEAKPEELRVFLEEAAGISKYKERRKETEQRLADSRENLSRVNDIRTELDSQVGKLRGQAEIAEQYKSLQADLQGKQHILWFLRRRDADADRTRHAEEISRTTGTLDAETTNLRSVESRLEAARQESFAASDLLNTAQAALYASNTEVARLEAELRHAQDKRARIERQREERRTQLGVWRNQRSQLTQALHMWASRTSEAAKRVVQTRTQSELERGRMPEAEQAYRAAQDRLGDARNAVVQAESRLQIARAGVEHIERALQAIALRREKLEAEGKALAEPDGSEDQVLRTRIADIESALSDAQIRQEDAQAACTGLDTERSGAAERLEEKLRDHTTAAAQLATLRQIQAAAEENIPLQEWLTRHELSELPRLWQKLRIDHGWEKAVEAVLHERLHALELRDPSRLAGIGRDAPPVKASLFHPGDGVTAQAIAGLEPLARRVHPVDPAVAGAVSDLLAGVFLNEGAPDQSLRSALTPGTMIVDRDGHCYTRYTTSFHAPDAADAGLLERQGEIEALDARCRDLEAEVAAARAAHADAESALSERQQVLEHVREQVAGLQGQKHQAHIELLKVEQAHTRFRERRAQIAAELDDIAKEDTKDRARQAESMAAIAHEEEEIRRSKATLDGVKAEYLSAEIRLTDQRKALQKAERDSHEALLAERECSAKISEIDSSVKVIDQQIETAEIEVARFGEELTEDPIPQVRASLDTAVEQRIGCEKTLTTARDAAETASAHLRTIEEGRQQTEARIQPLRDRIVELRLKEQAAQMTMEQFEAQLQEAGADREPLAARAADAPRPSTLQAELTRLTQAMNDLGAVNLAALEELKSGEERKGFLDAQATDLDEAVRTLEDAIRRIDRETRALLGETFESVNRHFGSLFPTLFGGGEAKLTMTGEEILDAGVQVMAQPPGKRNSTIHLLSGGEKALTAIALVFSMFQLNPAPFCLLDEVDAPLDDSNTVRFCDLVRKMSGQTQFLFISHNKIAMEMAGTLVGVTMPESGVSRVVAVDIDEALRIQEQLAA